MSVKRYASEPVNVDSGDVPKKSRLDSTDAETRPEAAGFSQLFSPFTNDIFEMYGTSEFFPSPLGTSPHHNLIAAFEQPHGVSIVGVAHVPEVTPRDGAPQGSVVKDTVAHEPALDACPSVPDWSPGQFVDYSQCQSLYETSADPMPPSLGTSGYIDMNGQMPQQGYQPAELIVSQPLLPADGMPMVHQVGAMTSLPFSSNNDQPMVGSAGATVTLPIRIPENDEAIGHTQAAYPFMAHMPQIQPIDTHSAASSDRIAVPIEPHIRNLLNPVTAWGHDSQMTVFLAGQNALLERQTAAYLGFHWRLGQFQELARLHQVHLQQLAQSQKRYFEAIPPAFHQDSERVAAFYRGQLVQTIDFFNTQLHDYGTFEHGLDW